MRCAYLTLNTIMTVEDLNEAQQKALLKAFAGAPAGLSVLSLQVHSRYMLLTELATLLPHHVRTQRQIVLSFRQGEQQGSTMQSDARTTRYTYN